MDDRTIALYLTIILIFVIILYWLSNKVSYRVSVTKKRKSISKNTLIQKKKEEIPISINDEIKINNNLNSSYPQADHTLSIYDIVENKVPEYSYQSPININVIEEQPIINEISVMTTEPEQEIKEVVKENVSEEIEEKIKNKTEEVNLEKDFYLNNGSFVIGEASEPIIEHKPVIEPEQETIIVEEPVEKNIEEEQENKKGKGNLSSLLIAASVIIPGLKHKLLKNSIKYINYKAKTPNKFMVGQDVSLNNSKCAYHEYDLLPDWLKDLIDRENYKILISNNDKVTSKGAALFSPMESNKDIRYLAFSGKDEQEIEESFLVGVGHFVDNYLGTLADAPKDENGVKFFSSNSREWTKLYEENKEELNKREVDSPSTYFSNTFKEYVTDKENLRENNPEAFKYMNKCMKVLEFHYQKDLVEDKCVNLEDYKENGKAKKSPIIENDLQLITNDYYNNYNEYEQNDVKIR